MTNYLDPRNWCPVTDTDAYKVSMLHQYNPDAKKLFAYVESRGGYDESVFFGLQMFLRKLAETPITEEMVDQGEFFWRSQGMPFERDPWLDIAHQYDGKLPVLIKSVPEGMIVPAHNVLTTIQTLDQSMPWLHTWMETALLRSIWFPATVATISREAKKYIKRFLMETADDELIEALLWWKLHDFGSRGVSTYEGAYTGGVGHLVNFMGTDTSVAALAAHTFYDAPLAGLSGSIPASEHSTITSWGRDGEIDAYRNMVNLFGKTPGAVFACVSDSYDIFNATRNIWAKNLLKIVAEAGSCAVIRPDSGDPLVIPLKVIEILGEELGYTINSKGYKVLPPYVRVIQGDGITIETIPLILQAIKDAGWSTENITFGMGGGLLQQCNRDTLKFAMKSSAFQDDAGTWYGFKKEPITDSGKNSKAGYLDLYRDSTGNLYTSDLQHSGGLLVDRYAVGELRNESTFDQVRARAAV